MIYRVTKDDDEETFHVEAHHWRDVKSALSSIPGTEDAVWAISEAPEATPHLTLADIIHDYAI